MRQGNLARIIFNFQNAGQERARGIDMGVQYQYQSPFGNVHLAHAGYLSRLVPSSVDPWRSGARSEQPANFADCR